MIDALRSQPYDAVYAHYNDGKILMTLKELEEKYDLDELFTGIWAAVEYGNDKTQYKRHILDMINDPANHAGER